MSFAVLFVGTRFEDDAAGRFDGFFLLIEGKDGPD